MILFAGFPFLHIINVGGTIFKASYLELYRTVFNEFGTVRKLRKNAFKRYQNNQKRFGTAQDMAP